MLSIFLFVSVLSQAQSSINSFLEPSDTLNKPKRTVVYVGESIALGATLVGLNQIWYQDYPQTNFHFINDNKQWLQMDKLGHVYSSYHLGRVGAELLEWSGASQKEQLIYGSTLGLGFLTVVEVFDGFSQEWGASSGDIIANVSGTALHVSQELLWNEQRITPKFSFQQTKFAAQRPETLGASLNEQILKDYNGQTYWLSFNIQSFTKDSFTPKWLNIAFGYGGEGMLYGTNTEAIQNSIFQSPYRQFYLSFDVDLTKIKTKSHFLKSLFSVFNTLKIPAPTLQYDDFNGVKAHFIYF
ncbi:YfiM family protein [Flavobacterium sp. N2820]|uniref:YfiM family protein n=1 Tax=Flavobacterium sp. N2820 TaxID=2986834 RepID=UPI0022247591|nr:YfiM family protein [Flavobacterium sp. N2820]